MFIQKTVTSIPWAHETKDTARKVGWSETLIGLKGQAERIPFILWAMEVINWKINEIKYRWQVRKQKKTTSLNAKY